MDIKNEEYLLLLDTKEVELNQLKQKVNSSAITVEGKEYVQLDIKKFEMLVQDVSELQYLKRLIKDGASEAVQFGILNMRLEERRAQRKR